MLDAIRAISADSHVAEPPNCYLDYIDPGFRDVAPFVERQDDGTDRFVVAGYANKLNIARVAAAGKTPQEIARTSGAFADVRAGAWDPKARLADQEVDGIAGEIVYPTVGMTLCSHPDPAYKNACMQAYNRWLADFCGGAPGRLWGIGQTAVRSVAEAVADLHRIKAQGHVGALLPYTPATGFDYDSGEFDPLWHAAAELDLPLSFHIVAGGKKFSEMVTRGPHLGAFNAAIWSIQELASMFVLSGVFERVPGLKLVLVEADAGWAAHYASRMDRAYKMHRFWLKCAEMKRLPSEYFYENVFLTYQDDPVAFATAHLLNPRQLLWANDYPHSDATWPHSQEILAQQTAHLGAQERRWILRDNTVDLYKLAPAL